MTITLHTVGRFKEVVFRDAEHDEVRAHSGLLEDAEAKELAERLREVADFLVAEPADDHQTTLPFFTSDRANPYAREQMWGARRASGF